MRHSITLTCAALLTLVLAWGAAGCSSSSSSGPAGEVEALEEAQAEASPEVTINTDAQGEGSGKDDAQIEPDAQAGCTPGDAQCVAHDTVKLCKAGGVWATFKCEAGTVCVNGDCTPGVCQPNALQCDGDTVRICRADAAGWELYQECGEGQACYSGVCVARTCEPGEKACAAGSLLTCDAAGVTWAEQPCPDGGVCFDGACLECVNDENCDPGQVCSKGKCAQPPLAILTQVLPAASLGAAYSTALEAEGGDGAYAWSVVAGDLPQGLGLSGEGTLSGTPGATGDFPFEVQVQDGQGATATRQLTLNVIGMGQELVITTGSPLPKATEGEDYQVTFQAEKGQPPYGWFITSGAPPAGLNMLSSGSLQGIPTEIGDFTFTVRVVDNATPVGFASKEFALNVKVAPLEIIGDQIYDLWITKIVVLPMLTIVPGIPLPYNQQLQAKGGLKPYHWSETDIPGLDWLLPKAGIPTGLSLAEDGSLSGSVTDTSLVMELSIPFTQIKLTGFFFSAKVDDSQAPADSDQALFLIPTLPVAF